MRAYMLEGWEPDHATRVGRMKKALGLLSDKLKKKHPELHDIYMNTNKPRLVDLGTLIVRKGQRKRGVGSKVVKSVTDFAKRHKAQTVLDPSGSKEWGSTSRGRLVKFYKRHGFKKAGFEIGRGKMVKEP